MGLISILLIGPGRVAPARMALTLALRAAVGIGFVMMGTAVRRFVALSIAGIVFLIFAKPGVNSLTDAVWSTSARTLVPD
jgi:hypothetical protein